MKNDSTLKDGVKVKKAKNKKNKNILGLNKLDESKILWRNAPKHFLIGNYNFPLQNRVKELLNYIDNYKKEYKKYEDTILFDEIYIDLLETSDLLNRYEENLLAIFFDKDAEIPPVFEQYMDCRGVICVQTVDKDIVSENKDSFIKIYG